MLPLPHLLLVLGRAGGGAKEVGKRQSTWTLEIHPIHLPSPHHQYPKQMDGFMDGETEFHKRQKPEMWASPIRDLWPALQPSGFLLALFPPSFDSSPLVSSLVLSTCPAFILLPCLALLCPLCSFFSLAHLSLWVLLPANFSGGSASGTFQVDLFCLLSSTEQQPRACPMLVYIPGGSQKKQGPSSS